MKGAFSTYHPLITFSYFALMLAATMLLMHPVYLALSLFGALSYAFLLSGRRALRFSLMGMLPLMLITAVINPLFNHEGATILFYAPWGNPVTLESIQYGVASGVMFAAMLGWFSCVNAVMTSDKITYLFGRAAPSLAMVFSMVLRFVPKYQAQLRVISAVQKGVGRDVSSGSVRQKIHHGVRILSVMTTWALENGIETADAMKARGCGLKGRTAFSLYRFERRDVAAAAALLFLGAALAAAGAAGACAMRYYPTARMAPFSPLALAAALGYAVLCFLPAAVDLKELYRWKHFESRI